MHRKLAYKLNNIFSFVREKKSSKLWIFFVLNIGLIIFQLVYITLRFNYLSGEIPFWYVMPWGDYQLAPKDSLYLIPAITSAIVGFGALFGLLFKRYYVRFHEEVIVLVISISNISLTFSLVRIILRSASPFDSFIDPLYFPLILPLVSSFVAVLLIAPRLIDFFKSKGIVTNPNHHFHPGMVLVKPSVRGGGFIFTAGFIFMTLIFVPLTLPVIGVLVVASLLALLGLIDDYQNTHPNSFFRFLEAPLVRLLLLFSIVTLLTLFGIQIGFIGNPFGGILQLSVYTLVPAVVTVIWVVWILNLLSWSNGIDGQYSGIIGIASMIIAVLALRFSPLLPEHLNYAKMAVIAAGCSFGLVRYTWHPSKVMWGFSAISAGLVLAALSILVNAKIATSVMIILVPFLDAVVTIARRLLMGRNPLKGDRGHLHHLLMDRGWSVRKIALFYWTTTALFGLIGLVASERYIVLVTLSLAVVVASFIVLLNLRSLTRKRELPLVG